jgi:hypothetical protein
MKRRRVEARAEGPDRARGAQGPAESASCAPSTRSARRSIASGASSFSPTPRKRSSRPAPHNARAGSVEPRAAHLGQDWLLIFVFSGQTRELLGESGIARPIGVLWFDRGHRYPVDLT